MTRTVLTATALAAAGLVLTIPAASGHAAPAPRQASPPARTATLDPAALPTGSAPHRAYLAGLRLTTKQGRTFRVPFAASEAGRLTLLGNSPRGFVVLRRTMPNAYTQRSDVFTVTQQGRSSSKHRFLRHVVNVTTNADRILLSHDGRRVLVSTTDRGYADDVTVVGVDGRRVATRSFDSTSVLDFSGPRVVLGDYATPGVVDWTIGSAPVRRGSAPTAGADIGRGVLFVESASDDRRSGPTLLTAPGAPTWLAQEDDWLLSPTGDDALGVSGRRLRVHAMAGGAVRSTTRLRLSDSLVAWESPTAYLAVARGPSGSAVVRCQAATGACRRTTPVVAQRLTMSVS